MQRSTVLINVLNRTINRTVQCNRQKSVRFKPKTAPVKAQKTPSMLALDNFDFYYAPLFGQHWSSIRLGLLTPHKYVAVLNNLSLNKDSNEQFLKDLGTVELISQLAKSKRRFDLVKQELEAKAVGGTSELEKEEGEEAQVTEEQEYDDRQSSGLSEFVPAEEDYTMGQLKDGVESAKNKGIK